MSSKEELLKASVDKSPDLIKAVEVIKVIEAAFTEVIAKWRAKVKQLEERIEVLEKAITEATMTVESTNVKITDFFGDKGQGGQQLVEALEKYKKMEVKGEE